MPRLRIVAGPNGSGKSFLTKSLAEDYGVHFYHYINADEIEAALRQNGCFSLGDYGVSLEKDAFSGFYRNHPLGKDAGLVEIEGREIVLAGPMPEAGYVGAVIADFVRRSLLQNGKTFSFETVMSGRDKIAFLQEAGDNGFSIYLYFVCTVDPEINLDRVANRVAEGGHDVPEALIRKRYHNSLDNLLPATQLATRVYFFDNSGHGHRVIAEYNRGDLKFNTNAITAWFRKYVLQKIAVA